MLSSPWPFIFRSSRSFPPPSPPLHPELLLLLLLLLQELLLSDYFIARTGAVLGRCLFYHIMCSEIKRLLTLWPPWECQWQQSGSNRGRVFSMRRASILCLLCLFGHTIVCGKCLELAVTVVFVVIPSVIASCMPLAKLLVNDGWKVYFLEHCWTSICWKLLECWSRRCLKWNRPSV